MPSRGLAHCRQHIGHVSCPSPQYVLRQIPRESRHPLLSSRGLWGKGSAQRDAWRPSLEGSALPTDQALGAPAACSSPWDRETGSASSCPVLTPGPEPAQLRHPEFSASCSLASVQGCESQNSEEVAPGQRQQIRCAERLLLYQALGETLGRGQQAQEADKRGSRD